MGPNLIFFEKEGPLDLSPLDLSPCVVYQKKSGLKCSPWWQKIMLLWGEEDKIFDIELAKKMKE